MFVTKKAKRALMLNFISTQVNLSELLNVFTIKMYQLYLEAFFCAFLSIPINFKCKYR